MWRRVVASSGIQWDALMGQQEGYFVTGKLQHQIWLLPNPNPNPLQHNFNSEQTKAPKGSWMGIFAAVVFPAQEELWSPPHFWERRSHPLPPHLHNWLLPGDRAAFVPEGKTQTRFITLGFGKCSQLFWEEKTFSEILNRILYFFSPPRILVLYRVFQGKSLWEMQKESVFRQKVGQKNS